MASSRRRPRAELDADAPRAGRTCPLWERGGGSGAPNQTGVGVFLGVPGVGFSVARVVRVDGVSPAIVRRADVGAGVACPDLRDGDEARLGICLCDAARAPKPGLHVADEIGRPTQKRHRHVTSAGAVDHGDEMARREARCGGKLRERPIARPRSNDRSEVAQTIGGNKDAEITRRTAAGTLGLGTGAVRSVPRSARRARQPYGPKTRDAPVPRGPELLHDALDCTRPLKASLLQLTRRSRPSKNRGGGLFRASTGSLRRASDGWFRASRYAN
jgi:hypothetical protein